MSRREAVGVLLYGMGMLAVMIVAAIEGRTAEVIELDMKFASWSEQYTEGVDGDEPEAWD